MAIPDYQTLMLPLLQCSADGEEHRLRDTVEDLGEQYGLTAEEKKELLPSGRAPLFFNRVAWAKTYLTKAGLVESVRRGYFRITPRGREILEEQPRRIDVGLLQRYPEFVEWSRGKKASPKPKKAKDDLVSETPEESLEAAHATLKAGVVAELLEQVSRSSWQFFERLVVDLIVAMGYGGDRRDAGKATKASRDGGVDGLINEDRLGLDVIYLQAKKWDPGRPVGRPELQKFAGALQGKRAKKGIFITTTTFSREAKDYVATIETKIVLIDGERLGELMFEHGVGVSTIGHYKVKRVDADYFEGS